MKAKSILILIVVAIVLIIFVQNVEVVTYNILFWEISMTRVIFFPFVLLIGFLLGYVFAKSKKKN